MSGRLKGVNERLMCALQDLHEMRTPLNAIVCLSELLAADGFADAPAERERAINQVHRSAWQALQLIDDLLDLVRGEAGTLTVQPERFRVSALFETLRASFAAPDHGVALVFDPGVDPTLDSDFGKISQILRNLVSNALKFTDSGSVTVSAQSLGERIRFTVEDTGIGIAPEALPRLFQPFTRVANRPAQVKGTGLGLSVSHRLAELLGGSMSVTSAVAQGSCFFVELPQVYGGSRSTPLRSSRGLRPSLGN